MKTILLILGLMWSSCVFGQIDTTVSYFNYDRSFELPEKITHGIFWVSEYERNRKMYIIQKGDFLDVTEKNQLRRFYEENYTIDLKYQMGFDSRDIHLPLTFTSGFDSVFIQILNPVESKYLESVWEIKDRYGTGTVTTYYKNGLKKNVWNFAGDTTIFGNKKSITKQPILHGWQYSYYPNGQLSHKYLLTYGVNDNISIGYYENGQMSYKTKSIDNNLFKEIHLWFESGELKSISYYDNNGVAYGIWKVWYKNGQLAEEIHYRTKDIMIKKWHQNGQLKSIEYEEEGKWENKKVKQYIEYYQNGILKEKGKYSNKEYTSDLNEDNSNNKHGKWTYYDDNGFLLLTQKFRHGKLIEEIPNTDEEIIYDYFYDIEEEYCRKRVYIQVEISDEAYEDKIYCINREDKFWIDTFYNYELNQAGDSVRYIYEIIHFLNNYGSIHYQRFYSNQKLMIEYHYLGEEHLKNDIKKNEVIDGEALPHGTATFWYRNGNIKWERTYERPNEYVSHLVKETTYYENGQQKSISYPSCLKKDIEENMERTWKTWYESGVPKESISYFCNRKHGEYILWNEKHTLSKRFNYQYGRLHGEQFYYDDEGQLIKTKVYEWNKKNSSPSKILSYKNGQLHDKQFYYDHIGRLIKTENYENGKLIKD